jgi:hypothetical protein
MAPGQMFTLMRTGARFTVVEVRGDQAIAGGVRTGARVLVTRTGTGYYGRVVTDNGASGASLFDSLTPAGPRYTMRDSGGR